MAVGQGCLHPILAKAATKIEHRREAHAERLGNCRIVVPPIGEEQHASASERAGGMRPAGDVGVQVVQ